LALVVLAALCVDIALAQDTGDASTIVPQGATQTDPALLLVMESMQPLVGEAEAEFRARAEQTLAAQTFAERLVASSYPEILPEIEARAAQVRASLALDYVMSQRVVVDAPTEDEIDAFIAENPRLFAGRASFRYATYVIAPETDTQRTVVEGLIAALEARTSLAAGDLQTFTLAMQEAEIPAVGRNATATSELIDPDILDVLEDIARAGRVLQLTTREDQFELLVLLQRTPDPVDPAVMRQQVALGLMRTELERQRSRIMASLASSSRRLPTTDPDVGPGQSVHRLVSETGSARNAGGGGDVVMTGVQDGVDIESVSGGLLNIDPLAPTDAASTVQEGMIDVMPANATLSTDAENLATAAAPAAVDNADPAGPDLTVQQVHGADGIATYLGMATIALAGFSVPMAFSVLLRWALRPSRKPVSAWVQDEPDTVALLNSVSGGKWFRIACAVIFASAIVSLNAALVFEVGLHVERLAAVSALAGSIALGMIMSVLGPRLLNVRRRKSIFWGAQTLATSAGILSVTLR
jgi:hypothetical protein